MVILIAYLLGIWTAIKTKNQNTAEDRKTPNGGHQQPPPNWPIAVGCAPPSLIDKEVAEQKKKKRRETIKFYVEIATLVVLALYFGATVLIWCANKKAADAAESAAQAAKGSADTAARQLGYFERVQSGNLIFKSVDVSIAPGKKPDTANVEITVLNSGATAANEISLKRQAGTIDLNHNPSPAVVEFPPNPSKLGPSVGPQQTYTFKYSTSFGGQSTAIIPRISWRDIFGCTHAISICKTYNAETKTWDLCPNLAQIHDDNEDCKNLQK